MARKHINYEFVQAVGGRWMVLVNGFQWGPITVQPDRSGAYNTTFATREEAVLAFCSSLLYREANRLGCAQQVGE